MRMLRRKNLNFVSAYSRKHIRRTEENLRLALLFLLPVGMIAFFCYQYLAHIERAEAAVEKAQGIQAYLSASEFTAKSMELERLQSDIAILDAYKTNMEGIHTVLASTPEITGEVMNLVIDAGEGKVVFSEFAFKGGKLSVSGSVTQYPETSLYAERLERAEIFSVVEYSGFTRNQGSEEEINKLPYNFSVVCEIR